MVTRQPKLFLVWLVCALATVSTARAADPAKVEGAAIENRDNPADPIAGREHWAFQPLKVEQPPVVESNDWPRSPIDFFILTQLEGANLQPAPRADRRTLVRRIYIQLIGLPPTPEQVTAFLDDDRPGTA